MTVAVTQALADGAHAVVCASTGNTAASAAAYAARAALVAVVLQPAGAVASGKLAQARALGARVLEVRGSFDEALAAARELAVRGTHVHVNSLNPDRLEGQKTAAFEIVETLGGTPDVLALPYGGGGNLTAYARGFTESGVGMPKLVGGEAAERSTTVRPRFASWSRRTRRPSTLRCRGPPEPSSRSPTRRSSRRGRSWRTPRASSASPHPLRGSQPSPMSSSSRGRASSASSPGTG